MHVYGLWITFFHRHKYIGNRKIFIDFEMGFMGRCALDNWTWTHTLIGMKGNYCRYVCSTCNISSEFKYKKERGDVTSASDDVGVGKGDNV